MKRHAKYFAVLIALVIFCSAAPTWAQRSWWNGYNSRDVLSAFRPVVAAASESTVRIICDGRDAELGTIVGADGWIVTKFSELREPIACRLPDKRQLPAEVVGQDPHYDLAMLKIDATDLKPVNWSDDETGPAVGQMLATISATGELPRAIGVVSVPRRPIPRIFGMLGINFDQSEETTPKVGSVLSGSGAERGGIRAGDIVTNVANKPVDSREKMIAIIHQYEPGDTITLVVHRGEEDVNITAMLAPPGEDGRGANRSERMNEMGKHLSKRSADFPPVIQHDTAINASDCGGPIVDLNGKVVGINIAAAGRTESYAAPADKVRALLFDMEHGKLMPKNPLPGLVVVKMNDKSNASDGSTDKSAAATNANSSTKVETPKP